MYTVEDPRKSMRFLVYSTRVSKASRQSYNALRPLLLNCEPPGGAVISPGFSVGGMAAETSCCFSGGLLCSPLSPLHPPIRCGPHDLYTSSALRVLGGHGVEVGFQVKARRHGVLVHCFSLPLVSNLLLRFDIYAAVLPSSSPLDEDGRRPRRDEEGKK